MTERLTTGSCLCGAIRYEYDGLPVRMTNCHCSMCRKHHGAAYATFVAVPQKRFRLVTGQDLLRTYRSSSSVERTFCSTCGASLFWKHDGQSAVWITAGTLDGDPGYRPEEHIYVGSKAPWHELPEDGLPWHR